MKALRMQLLFADLVALAVLGRLTQVDLLIPAGLLIYIAAFGDQFVGRKEKHI
jgi:hypothetical protein